MEILRVNSFWFDAPKNFSGIIIDSKNNQYWHQDGKLHRVGDPAVEWASGGNYWYQNGILHRLDGPAIIEADGTKKWVQNGKYHRLDGPAIKKPDGTEVFYVEEKWLTEQQFNTFRAMWESTLSKQTSQLMMMLVKVAKML